MANIVRPSTATTPYEFTQNERYTLGFGVSVAIYVGLYASGLLPTAWQIACPSYSMFGLQCPGCGLSRAGSALAHGRLYHALTLNPLVLWVGTYFCYRFLAIIYGLSTTKHLIQSVPKQARSIYVFTFLATVCLLWAIRMVEWFQNFYPS